MGSSIIPVFTAEEANFAVQKFAGANKIRIAQATHGVEGLQLALGDSGERVLEVLSNDPDRSKSMLGANSYTYTYQGQTYTVPVQTVQAEPEELQGGSGVSAGADAAGAPAGAGGDRPPSMKVDAPEGTPVDSASAKGGPGGGGSPGTVPFVDAGHPAQGDGVAAAGTAGWNIWLDGQLACVSARHAICASNSCASPGAETWVALNGQWVAKVYCVEPLVTVQEDPNAENLRDLAIARYIRPDYELLPRGQFIACGGSHNPPQYPYPARLAAVGTVGPSDSVRYHKVGRPAPKCRGGKLIKAGQRRAIPLPNGKSAVLINQLIFTRLSNGGDSGAVVVRDSDNAVVGVIVSASGSGSTGTTTVSPLYNIGWNQGVGSPTMAPPSGSQFGVLPVFTRPKGAGCK